MATESVSSRYTDLDLWPTADAVAAMLEGQLAAAAAVQAQSRAIAAAAEAAADRLRGTNGRLIYIGAGTSGRLAVQDGVELGPTYGWTNDRMAFLLAGGMDAMLRSVEGAEDDAEAGAAELQALQPGPADVAIGVAASGATPYTVAAVRAAADAGALTVGIASNADTALLQASEHPLFLDTGVEVVAGSTRMKAGTAQKLVLNMISTGVMLRLGRVEGNLMADVQPMCEKLVDRAQRLVMNLANVDAETAQRVLDECNGNVRDAVAKLRN